MTNIFDMPVHPAADIFPMIPRDELAELAADIAENGLIHPIVVKDGVLIDGRNRRAACEMVDIEPEIIELNGQDPEAYIISSNINRRHMTKGQQAMAVAMIYPDAEHGGSRKKGSSLKNKHEINSGYLSQARTILKYGDDLSKTVLLGATPLSDAYKEALRRKMASENEDVALETLRSDAPDLADLVIDGLMNLDEALAARDKRIQNEKINRAASAKILKDFIASGKAAIQSAKHIPTIDGLRGWKEEFENNVGLSVKDIKKSIDEIEIGCKIINSMIGEI